MDREEQKDKKSSPKRKRVKNVVVLVIVILAVCGVVYFYQNNIGSIFSGIGGGLHDAVVGEEGKVTTVTKTTLEEVLEISELSTVDFFYNAVARAYEDDGTTVKYYVAYEGKVNAGINFDDIVINIDDENKKITLTMPEPEIQNTTVDFGSMEYIFVDDSAETETVSQEAYELCRADLAERAQSEDQLLAMAKENASSAVEALVDPWVKQIDPEYTVTIA